MGRKSKGLIEDMILVRVTGYDLINVRERPSMNSAILFRARRNTEYLVESLGFSWVRVYDKTTKEEVGYVMRELLEEVLKNE